MQTSRGRSSSIVLKSATPIRTFVLDRGVVDVDLHILRLSEDGWTCIARGHHLVDLTLEPGVYDIVIDTWVGTDGIERGGPFQFVALKCDLDDSACTR